MKTKKTPAPRRAGNAVTQEARFARVLNAAGDDPAALTGLLAVMEGVIFGTRPRRRNRLRLTSY